jgi:hypothetical protein
MPYFRVYQPPKSVPDGWGTMCRAGVGGKAKVYFG